MEELDIDQMLNEFMGDTETAPGGEQDREKRRQSALELEDRETTAIEQPKPKPRLQTGIESKQRLSIEEMSKLSDREMFDQASRSFFEPGAGMFSPGIQEDLPELLKGLADPRTSIPSAAKAAWDLVTLFQPYTIKGSPPRTVYGMDSIMGGTGASYEEPDNTDRDIQWFPNIGALAYLIGQEAPRGILGEAMPEAWVEYGEERQRLGGIDTGERLDTPMWDMIAQDYSQAYGENRRETFRKDPFRVLGDFAAGMSGAGLALRGGGRIGGAVGRSAGRAMKMRSVQTSKGVGRTGDLAERMQLIKQAQTQYRVGHILDQFGKSFEGGMSKLHEFANVSVAESMRRSPTLQRMAETPIGKKVGLLQEIMENKAPYGIPSWRRGGKLVSRVSRSLLENWGMADLMDAATYPIIAPIEAFRFNVDRATRARQDQLIQAINLLDPQRGVRGGLDEARPPEIDSEVLRAWVDREQRGVVGDSEMLAGTDPTHELNQVGSQYAVLDANDIVVSHRGRAENPDYPQEFQPRDRSAEESYENMLMRAQNLDPALLVQRTPSFREGPPIVTLRDGNFYVVAGNGRMLSINEAYGSGLAGGEALKQEIINRAQEFGIADTGRIEGMERPVLVRVITSALDLEETAEFARLTNISASEAYKATEVADQYQHLLTTGRMGEFNFGDGTLAAAIDNPVNEEFVRTVLGELDDSIRPQYFTNNNPNEQGRQFIETLMMRHAYPSEQGRRMTEILIETRDEGMRNILNAAGATIPRLLQVQNLIENGMRERGWDIRENIAQAVMTYQDVRAAGGSAQDYFEQTLFGEMTELAPDPSPETKALMLFFDQNRARPAILRRGLQNYFTAVIEAGHPDEFALGIIERTTKKQAFQQAFGQDANLYDVLDEMVDETELQQIADTADEEIAQAAEEALENNVDFDQFNQRVSSIIETMNTRIENRRVQAVNEGVRAAGLTGENQVQLHELAESLTMENLAALRQMLTEAGASEELLSSLPLRPSADYARAMDYYDLTDSPFREVGHGYVQMRHNRPLAAIEEATRAIQADPTDVYAHNLRGSANLRLGRLDEAEADFNRSIELDPQNEFAYFWRSLTKKKRGDEAGANEDFEVAERISERTAYRESTDISEEAAQREFDRRLEADRREPNARSLVMRGQRYFRGAVEGLDRPSYNEAIARAQAALRVDSGYTDAHILLGQSRYRQGVAALRTSDFELANRRFRQAGDAFRNGLALESDNRFLLNGMAWYHYRQGNEARRIGDETRADYHLEEAERLIGQAEASAAGETAVQRIEGAEQEAGDLRRAIETNQGNLEDIMIAEQGSEGVRFVQYRIVDENGVVTQRNLGPFNTDAEVDAAVQHAEAEIQGVIDEHQGRLGGGTDDQPPTEPDGDDLSDAEIEARMQEAENMSPEELQQQMDEMERQARRVEGMERLQEVQRRAEAERAQTEPIFNASYSQAEIADLEAQLRQLREESGITPEDEQRYTRMLTADRQRTQVGEQPPERSPEERARLSVTIEINQLQARFALASQEALLLQLADAARTDEMRGQILSLAIQARQTASIIPPNEMERLVSAVEDGMQGAIDAEAARLIDEAMTTEFQDDAVDAARAEAEADPELQRGILEFLSENTNDRIGQREIQNVLNRLEQGETIEPSEIRDLERRHPAELDEEEMRRRDGIEVDETTNRLRDAAQLLVELRSIRERLAGTPPGTEPTPISNLDEIRSNANQILSDLEATSQDISNIEGIREIREILEYIDNRIGSNTTDIQRRADNILARFENREQPSGADDVTEPTADAPREPETMFWHELRQERDIAQRMRDEGQTQGVDEDYNRRVDAEWEQRTQQIRQMTDNDIETELERTSQDLRELREEMAEFTGDTQQNYQRQIDGLTEYRGQLIEERDRRAANIRQADEGVSDEARERVMQQIENIDTSEAEIEPAYQHMERVARDWNSEDLREGIDQNQELINTLERRLQEVDDETEANAIRDDLQSLREEQNAIRDVLQRREQEADVSPEQVARMTEDLETARSNVEDMTRQLEEQRQTLEELPSNARRQRADIEGGIGILEQGIQTWQRVVDRLEGELGDAARPASDAPDDDIPFDRDEPPEEPPDDLPEADEPPAEDTPEIEPEVPSVSVSELQRLRQMLTDYIAGQRRSLETPNETLVEYERALEALTTDMGNAVVDAIPQYANTLSLYDDAQNLAAATVQAHFMDFLRRELESARDPERYSRVVDQIYDDAVSAEDISNLIAELSSDANIRVQEAFLERVMDDWQSGDTEAISQLAERMDDGRLEAMLGADTVEAFSDLDTIIENYLSGRPAMTQAEEARRFEAHLEATRDEVRRWSEESQRRGDRIITIDNDAARVRRETADADQRLQVAIEARNREGQALLDMEAELSRLEAEERANAQAMDDANRSRLAQLREQIESYRKTAADAAADAERIRQTAERGHAEAQRLAKEKAIEEEARSRADAQKQAAMARQSELMRERRGLQEELNRIANYDVADELPGYRGQNRRQDMIGDSRANRLDEQIAEQLRSNGENIPKTGLAMDNLRNFAGESKQNEKVLRETITEVLGDGQKDIKRTLMYLSGTMLRNVVPGLIAGGAAGYGIYARSPLAAAAGLAIAGGLWVLANRWGVQPVFKRYKPLIKGARRDYFMVKALQAMMSEAWLRGTLAGFRVLRQFDESEEKDNGKMEIAPQGVYGR